LWWWAGAKFPYLTRRGDNNTQKRPQEKKRNYAKSYSFEARRMSSPLSSLNKAKQSRCVRIKQKDKRERKNDTRDFTEGKSNAPKEVSDRIS